MILYQKINDISNVWSAVQKLSQFSASLLFVLANRIIILVWLLQEE
jgi:hypothetical protein